METFDLPAIRRRTDAKLSELNTARTILKREREALVSAEAAQADAEEAQKVAQVVAQGVQQQAQDRIAGIVTRCLAAVFPNPYKFRIRFEQKRGQTEASLEFVRDDVAVDPLEASGGGMVDVAAFALRLSCILLSRPPVRRVMVLDEPLKFLSKDYRAAARTLLEVLSRELSVQFIIVTHLKEFEVGTVVSLAEGD